MLILLPALEISIGKSSSGKRSRDLAACQNNPHRTHDDARLRKSASEIFSHNLERKDIERQMSQKLVVALCCRPSELGPIACNTPLAKVLSREKLQSSGFSYLMH